MKNCKSFAKTGGDYPLHHADWRERDPLHPPSLRRRHSGWIYIENTQKIQTKIYNYFLLLKTSRLGGMVLSGPWGAWPFWTPGSVLGAGPKLTYPPRSYLSSDFGHFILEVGEKR